MDLKPKNKISELCRQIKQDFQSWDNLPEPPRETQSQRRQQLYATLKKQLKQLSK